MPRRYVRTRLIVTLLVATCLAAGCSGPVGSNTPPVPTPTLAPTLAPTVAPTSTASVLPTPTRSAPTPTPEVKECGAAPCLTATAAPPGLDPAFAALVDPEPGPTTLTNGTDVQNGAYGYAVWCTASGQMAIYDTFGRVKIPTAPLVAPQGGTVMFAYLGADPVREILARIYPAAPTGTPPPPGQFIIPKEGTGNDLPVMRSDRKGAITLAVPPGEYVLFVNVHVQSGAKALTCGSQYQFRLRVM